MEHLGGLLNVSSQFTQLQELIDLWTGRACVSLSKGGCLYKCGFLSVNLRQPGYRSGLPGLGIWVPRLPALGNERPLKV